MSVSRTSLKLVFFIKKKEKNLVCSLCHISFSIVVSLTQLNILLIEIYHLPKGYVGMNNNTQRNLWNLNSWRITQSLYGHEHKNWYKPWWLHLSTRKPRVITNKWSPYNHKIASDDHDHGMKLLPFAAKSWEIAHKTVNSLMSTFSLYRATKMPICYWSLSFLRKPDSRKKKK